MFNKLDMIWTAMSCDNARNQVALLRQGRFDQFDSEVIAEAHDLVQELENGFSLDESRISSYDLPLYGLRVSCNGAIKLPNIVLVREVLLKLIMKEAVTESELAKTEETLRLIAHSFSSNYPEA